MNNFIEILLNVIVSTFILYILQAFWEYLKDNYSIRKKKTWLIRKCTNTNKSCLKLITPPFNPQFNPLYLTPICNPWMTNLSRLWNNAPNQINRGLYHWIFDTDGTVELTYGSHAGRKRPDKILFTNYIETPHVLYHLVHYNNRDYHGT